MVQRLEKLGSGLILGKFLPPHLGHQYLIDFARNWVDRLTVVVGTLEAEPIPGRLRYEWVKEMAPGVEVLHLTDENPQEPHEHPDFWRIWHDSLRRLVPQGPDYLFASESYGFKLAEILGARYIPVDHDRALAPISGTAVREDPIGAWEFLPPPVRPYFVLRAAIIGPESTGKSILAARLAGHFRTVFVSEYARGLIDLQDNEFTFEDMEIIARGQIASEEALARQANRVLICDTETLTTTIWSEIFFGRIPAGVLEQANRREYDLYLVAEPDSPWVDDPQRYLPHGREEFLERCLTALESRGRPYVRIGGSWEDRFDQAVRAVEDLIESRRGPVRVD